MNAALAPLFDAVRIHGPARTARIVPGENAAIHRAIHFARPGEVLVVASGDRSFGPFGELLARSCLGRGVGGLVIDGTIRDTARLKEMRFPVFCLGANPRPTRKSNPGEIDVEIQCAGVRVRPGDIVVGDDDGVVVVPGEITHEVADRVRVLTRREESVRKRLESGESTCEIFGIEP